MVNMPTKVNGKELELLSPVRSRANSVFHCQPGSLSSQDTTKMDMMTSDPAIANLPLSDPRCNSEACNAFYAGENVSQAAVSWNFQAEYAHWTTWYYLAGLFLFMVVHAYHWWMERTPRFASTLSTKLSSLEAITALLRSVSYRRFSGRIADVLSLRSCGSTLIILGTTTLAAIAMFGVRPYYRERDGYGSPPLAIRSGMMALALTPIIVALAGKFNVVTLLTGIGHEKLNTMHRYLAWICFALSVAHTVPFFVAPLKDGGLQQLNMDFYTGGINSELYNGIPTLALLFFLVTFSIPYIRKRVYELFAYSHVVAAIVYFGLMFWHTNNNLNSWAYIWATLAVYLFSVFGRIFRKTSAFSATGRWFQTFPSTIRRLPADMMKLEVLVPAHYTWQPGQHCFLRFPSIAPLDNHPFTIASIPHRSGVDSAIDLDQNVLSFLIRKHSGFTRRLLHYIESQADIVPGAIVDGPYGGLLRALENAYDSVILVAGGGGITSSIPWLLHLSQLMKDQQHPVVTRDIRLVWVVKHQADLKWMTEELARVLAGSVMGSIFLDFYVTRETANIGDGEPYLEVATPDEHAHAKDEEKLIISAVKATSSSRDSIHYGRPQLTTLLPGLINAPRTAVLCCGPESLKIDTSNAVASIQTRVLRGHLKEVFLFTETFSW